MLQNIDSPTKILFTKFHSINIKISLILFYAVMLAGLA